MRMQLVVAAVLGLSACSPSVPATEFIAPTAHFAVVGSDSVPAGATVPATLRGAARSIEMLGIVDVPSPCHTFSARVVYEGPQVVARIVARATPDACAPIPTKFAFRIVQQLNPGDYVVRVMFEGPERGSPMWGLSEQKVTVRAGS